MIDAPKNDGDWPDRHLDCEMAMEDAFLAIADRLLVAGLSLEETAEQLIAGATDAEHWVAEDLRQVVAWTVHAGWRKAEASYAIIGLAGDFKLSVEERRNTICAIKLAWERPDR